MHLVHYNVEVYAPDLMRELLEIHAGFPQRSAELLRAVTGTQRQLLVQSEGIYLSIVAGKCP
jgi:hypothetical protein